MDIIPTQPFIPISIHNLGVRSGKGFLFRLNFAHSGTTFTWEDSWYFPTVITGIGQWKTDAAATRPSSYCPANQCWPSQQRPPRTRAAYIQWSNTSRSGWWKLWKWQFFCFFFRERNSCQFDWFLPCHELLVHQKMYLCMHLFRQTDTMLHILCLFVFLFGSTKVDCRFYLFKQLQVILTKHHTIQPDCSVVP